MVLPTKDYLQRIEFPADVRRLDYVKNMHDDGQVVSSGGFASNDDDLEKYDGGGHKTMNRPTAVTLAIVIGTAGILCAEATWPAKSTSKRASVADVRRLMTVMNVNSDEMIQGIMGSMKQFTKSSLEGEAGEKFETMFDEFMKGMDFSEITELTIPVYQKYFTPEDIRGMITFYESPVGKKWVGAMPKIMADSMAISMKWMQDKMSHLKKMLEEQRTKEK